jgi:NOL1/NOP2/fmu family ribosome biogenesis protein
MKFDFYSSKDRKKLVEELNAGFGISEVPKVLFETGKEKIRGFSGDLNIDEIYALDRITNIEFLGLYLFRKDLSQIRLGFDGALLLKDEINKNIVDISSEQLEKWMTGHNLDIVLDKGMYVVKCGDDFFGCGLSDGKHLINFVPKERRIRRS